MNKDQNKKKKRFVLSNGAVTNSYGFRVLTEGIELERFKMNPVCLNEHRQFTKDVLGTWEDIEVQGHILSASPRFDTEDPEGKEVVRKINNGTIKGCSIGIKFRHEDIKIIEDIPVVVKCELMEASFCAVPSNSSAIVLYNEEGKALSEKQVQELCLSVQNKENNHKENSVTMKKLVAHLQLEDNAGEDAVLEAVKSVEAKLTASENEKVALKAKISELEAKETQRQKTELETELALAVKDGRIDEQGKAPILELPYDSAMKLLKALPKREAISPKTKSKESKLADFDKMSWDELDRGNHLAHLKAEYPEYYAERFKKEFNKEPK